MNTFWLKIAGFAVVVVGLIVLVKVFSSSDLEVKTEKTVYDVWEQDDKRLRAEPQAEPTETAKQAPVTKQIPEAKPAVEPTKPKFKELSPEDEVRAQKLFEMALFHRKSGRLPGLQFKKMVDYCREIIEKYPDSVYAFRARRMLRDIPRRYRERYNITDEEMGL